MSCVGVLQVIPKKMARSAWQSKGDLVGSLAWDFKMKVGDFVMWGKLWVKPGKENIDVKNLVVRVEETVKDKKGFWVIWGLRVWSRDVLDLRMYDVTSLRKDSYAWT
jgi:hypothetical protein